MHARLSASASHRWLACPPSVALCEQYPDQTSAYAEEGTQAHALCEMLLKKELDIHSVDEVTPLDQEMADCANEYVSYIMAQPREFIAIEQQLDFSAFVPGGFGTCDCIILNKNKIQVIDFKYGKGVKVDAKNNSQMMLYALGAAERFNFIFDFNTVEMTIFQPRIGNISTWETTVDELYRWAREVVAPIAKLADQGKGEFACGDWCRFCLAKADCKHRTEEQLKVFKDETILSNDELAEILPKLDHFMEWASDLKENALQKLLAGEKIKGFKLVEGRSVRKFTDEKQVETAAKTAGITDIYKVTLKGITDLEKMVGKKKFSEVFGELIYKPVGKPTVAPITDKRPEYSEFKEI